MDLPVDFRHPLAVLANRMYWQEVEAPLVDLKKFIFQGQIERYI
jgi:hypothetical protein